MKVFWVLAWDQYYPLGGLRNVKSTHETREQAEAAAEKLRTTNDLYYDFVEVVDVSGMIGK